MKYFYFILYRFFAFYLPKSNVIFLGPVSKKIRYFFVKRMIKKGGDNVNIERKAWFGMGKNIEIGDNSGIGVNAIIPSNTIIGKNVMMGPDCIIYEANHNFDRTDLPMNHQGHSPSQKTVIGDDVWIGGRVIFLPGKTIGNGVIIGAGSVITKDLHDFGIYGGNPARLIKSRKS